MIAKLYTSFDAPITIQHNARKTYFLNQIDLARLKKIEGITAVSKELEELVVLRKNQRWINAYMHAVDAEFIKHASVSKHLINAVGASYLNQSDYVFLGAEIFSKLKLGLGSAQNDIQMYAPKRGIKMRFGKTPFHSRRVQAGGAINYNQDINSAALLWNYETAAELLKYDGMVTRLNVYVKPNSELEQLRDNIKNVLGPNFIVKTQAEKNELIYKTSKSERLVVFVVLLFVFILASFNLIATLTMLIYEKQENFQILKAVGMTNKDRFRIFFFEGLFLAAFGVLFGLLLGWLICWLQQAFGWLIVPGANVPFPIVFKAQDFIAILLSSSLLSLIFTFFPVRYLLRKM